MYSNAKLKLKNKQIVKLQDIVFQKWAEKLVLTTIT